MNTRVTKLEKSVIYIYCLFFALPSVSQIFPTALNVFIYIVIGVVILRKLKMRVTDIVFLVIGWFLIVVVALLRQGISVKSFYVSYYNTLPIIVGLYLIKCRNKLFCKKILIFLLLAILFTTITTSYGLIKDPTISRFLATGDKEFYEMSKWGNVGGFEFIYSLVVLLTCYVVLCKKKEISFAFFLLIFVVGIYCIVLSQYTLALLISISSIIIFVFSSSEFGIKKCILTGGLSLLVIFQKSTIVFILNALKGIINSDIVITRLDYILNSINTSYNKSDVSLRFDAYEKSLKAFEDNWYSFDFVSNFTEIGGHSTILDVVGIMGIFGTIILLMFFIMYWQKFFKYSLKKSDKGYFMFLFIEVVALQIFNTFSLTNYVSFIVMPLMARVLSADKS